MTEAVTQSQENVEQEVTETESHLVLFKLDTEEFGVDIFEVIEIIKFEQITPIPNAEKYVAGVINLRGKIIVVVDLATKLGLKKKEIDKDTRIIVIEVGTNLIGMIVDSATEVIQLPKGTTQEAPDIITKKINNNFLKGVAVLESRLIVLLDATNTLSAQEIEHAKQQVN